MQEVEILQKDLERQQKILTKWRKMSTTSTTYTNSSYIDVDNTTNMQEVKTPERSLEKQQKTRRKMSVTIPTAYIENSYNEDASKTSQRGSQPLTTVCKSPHTTVINVLIQQSTYSLTTFDDDVKSPSNKDKVV